MILAASSTSVGTWIALGTLVVLMIPVYFMSLKAASAYGALEQKVDTIAIAQAAATVQHHESVKLIGLTLDKLTDKFNEHAIQDAGHFGELRGMLAPTPPTVTTP